MALPIILAVEDEPDVLRDLERDLAKRYSADYQVLTSESPQRGLERLAAAQREKTEVAIVIASQRMLSMSGIVFLVRAHELHPLAPPAPRGADPGGRRGGDPRGGASLHHESPRQLPHQTLGAGRRMALPDPCRSAARVGPRERGRAAIDGDPADRRSPGAALLSAEGPPRPQRPSLRVLHDRFGTRPRGARLRGQGRPEAARLSGQRWAADPVLRRPGSEGGGARP